MLNANAPAARKALERLDELSLNELTPWSEDKVKVFPVVRALFYLPSLCSA